MMLVPCHQQNVALDATRSLWASNWEPEPWQGQGDLQNPT